MIRLRKINSSNWAEMLRLSVRSDQQRFIANYSPIAAIVLSKAYVRLMGADWEPYAIYLDETPIGLFAFVSGIKDSEDWWIFHYFVDHQYQNRGYGKAGLREAIELARNNGKCIGISLVVHPENAQAKRMYESMGFVPTGGRRWDHDEYRNRFASK